MYDPNRQYRCTIIRGKAQTELDNLLPSYSRIIEAICPINEESFKMQFDEKLSYLLGNKNSKTLANHRTEIAGKLFGLWYNQDGIVYLSNLGKFILESNDNPAFFKHIAIKFQFPNGMDKNQTIRDRIDHEIKFRPTPFLLAVMKLANTNRIILSKREIAYYILNSLDVLQGWVTPEIVFKQIIEDRDNGIIKRVHTPGKQSSWDMQHITEFLNILELSNLIKPGYTQENERGYHLNHSEYLIINKIIDKYLNKLEFDPYSYNLNNPTAIKTFYQDWIQYYSSPLDPEEIELVTHTLDLISENSLVVNNRYTLDRSLFSVRDTQAIGDEGEQIALEFEKERVKGFHPRLVNKVIFFGRQRGLGYDISSIFAEGDNPEYAMYIEVKTTKRVTEPPEEFKDQFDMTRNEWIAAEQYPENYFIYRVYLYNQGVKIFKLASPAKLREERAIYAEPLRYHIEFNNTSGRFINE
jgi:hypothetical protein